MPQQYYVIFVQMNKRATYGSDTRNILLDCFASNKNEAVGWALGRAEELAEGYTYQQHLLFEYDVEKVRETLSKLESLNVPSE